MLYDDGRLLFFDTHHIDSLENTTLTMNPAVKCGPCLSIEKDWELHLVRASSIVFCEGVYRLYYTVRLDDGRGAMAFVTSKDGVTWDRPNLGAVEFNGSRKNNLVDTGGASPDETCVFIDPTGPDEHRFKCITHKPFVGLFMLTSPDGIRFTRSPELLLYMGTDNHMSAFYDPTIKKYRLYIRGGDKSRSIIGWSGSRSVAYAETDDLFERLRIDEDAPDPLPFGYERADKDGNLIRPLPGINKELHQAMVMDDMDPAVADMYQPAVLHYAPNAYVAFPTLYYHYPGPPEGFINDGVLDLQFASSRDGRLWRRDLRGSYTRLDLPDGPATKSMHMLVGVAPGQYTLSQYYCGGRRTHGEGRTPEKRNAGHQPSIGDPIAFRLSQRIDGFVSADSAYTGGSLLTKPFQLKGKELRINIDTSASGVAHAALLDEGGLQLKLCRLENSDRIQGNDTQYLLSWRGKSDLSKYVGWNVRLLVKSRAAKLFAVYPEPASLSL